jgi:hypothetical protein
MLRKSAITCLALLAINAAPAPDAPSIGTIKAELFYENSGTFSPDILTSPDFGGWNTIIGEGPASEPANDLLLLIEVRAGGRHSAGVPLYVIAHGYKNRVVVERTFRHLLTPTNGRMWKAVLLRDIGCEGRLSIDVSLGQDKANRVLQFRCGE